MPLEKYLMDEEKVLAQCGVFYATNKRLIRYQKRFLSEELDDIPYGHLTSVGVARAPRKGLIWAGLTILGLVLSSLVTVVVMAEVMKALAPIMGGLGGAGGLGGSNGSTGLSIPGVPAGAANFNMGVLIPLHIVGIGISLAMVVVGVFVPTVFVQFRAPGLDKNAEARFRLHGGRRDASLDLMRIVRQQSLTKEPESTDVGPKEDKGSQPAKQ